MGDPTAFLDLLGQIEGDIIGFMADGAYDGAQIYRLLESLPQDHPVEIVIPPPKNAVMSAQSEPTNRDKHIKWIKEKGRLGWQQDTGYGKRSRVEAQIGKWKAVIGNKLMANTLPNQKTEVKIGQKSLNRMNELGTPMFERIF